MQVFRGRFLWCAASLALLLLTLATLRARAFELAVIEMSSVVDGEEKAYLQVKDLVTVDKDGQAHLNLFPDRNAEHHQIISILSPGMPFDDVKVRDSVAKYLSDYPPQAQPHLTLSLEVSPIGDIGNFVPGVKDKRRVTGVAISGFLERTPSACLYDILETGAVDFDIGNLKGVILECEAAVRSAIKQGKRYSEAVYRAGAVPAGKATGN